MERSLIEKIKNEVYFISEDIVQLDNTIVNFLKEKALSNPRGRARLCTHQTNEDTLHQMIIAIRRDSYIRPHKHHQKIESFHLIEGKADIVIFKDDGDIQDIIRLEKEKSFFYRLNAAHYHTLIIHTPLLVIHEITNGPFKLDAFDYAVFSPNEDDFMKVKDYMNHLKETCQNTVRETKNLSIVIPAFNEEEKIAMTLKEVYEVAKKMLDDFEIMVIDDGSKDNTHAVAKATANLLGPEIRITQQKTNQGVGAAFFLGLSEAKFTQICLIPGDHAFQKQSIETLFSHCGNTPLVITYRENMEVRTPLRYVLSRIATYVFRIITGFKIRDGQSLYLFPVEETKQLAIHSKSYSYHMEVLCRLLRKMKNYVEVPVKLNPNPDSSSRYMKIKPLILIGMTSIKLIGLRLIGKLG